MLYPDFNELVALRKCRLNLPQTSLRAVKTAVSGNHASSFRGHGLEFDSVREYVPGDDIRNIDWRVTARTGSAHLKIFNEERERHRIICVDSNASMRFGTRNTFKSVQAARVAALLGWRGLAAQDRVSGCLFGSVPAGIQVFPPKRTHSSFCALLKGLAAAPIKQSSEQSSEQSIDQPPVPLESALDAIFQKAPSGSLIYVISDFMELKPDFYKQRAAMQLAQRCELVFVAINDPADRELAAIGSLCFSSDPSNKVFINTSSDFGRKAWVSQWQENRQFLKEGTSRLKIPLIELSTESDVTRNLMHEMIKSSASFGKGRSA